MQEAIVLRSIVVILSLTALHCGDAIEAIKDPVERIPLAPCAQTQHTGDATYYTWANGEGNCMFNATPNDLNVAAMNAIDYAGSGVCGTCITVTGPRGRVTVRVVDQCPECPEGDVDLSPFAFAQIADLPQGRVPVRWHFVPCPVQGNIVFHFKDGSNQWWTAVQVRNHRNRIQKLEYQLPNGTFKVVQRLDYNYFVESTGMGPGPYTLRVTDIYGNMIVSSGIPHIENGDVRGAGQFPECIASTD